MTIEQLQEELGRLPVFPHTEIRVQAESGEWWEVQGLAFDSTGLIIEITGPDPAEIETDDPVEIERL